MYLMNNFIYSSFKRHYFSHRALCQRAVYYLDNDSFLNGSFKLLKSKIIFRTNILQYTEVVMKVIERLPILKFQISKEIIIKKSHCKHPLLRKQK